MVDIERRLTGLNPGHLAGLRRLSIRAANPSTQIPVRTGLLSFTSLANNVISHLLNSGTRVHKGLTPTEFARLEAEFNFHFPPDLRAILSSALPMGSGFPNWRFKSHIRALIDLPIAAISFQIARNEALWPKSWGPRPSNRQKSLRFARIALKKAPVLIPLFNHCYIPCNPSLAGNPVFFIDENQIFCCGFDLKDFFERESIFETHDPCFLTKQRFLSSKSSRKPRWVEFWSEMATNSRRKNSSCSLSSSCSSSPEQYFDLSVSMYRPIWVEEYLKRIGTVLRNSGWDESDVSEILNVSGCGFYEEEEEELVLLDSQSVFDALLLKWDRFSDSLRRAGWSCDEVTDTFCFDFRTQKREEISVEIVD